MEASFIVTLTGVFRGFWGQGMELGQYKSLHCFTSTDVSKQWR